MEQEKLELTRLKQALRSLKQRVLEDEDIKEMFERNFPELDFQEAVNGTINELLEYAIEKDYSVEDLSFKGVQLFFTNILDTTVEDDGEIVEEALDEDEEEYGKA